MIVPSPLCTSSQSSSRPIDQCFCHLSKNRQGNLLGRILLEGAEETVEEAAWIEVVGDEVAIRTVHTAMDMAMATPMASTLRHHTFPRTLPHSLGRRSPRLNRDSGGMAPTEDHLFKIIVIIILASRAEALSLEEPLPPAGCLRAVVALRVMEVPRPILTPLINTVVEAILVGIMAAVEGIVDRQTMGTGATVARQAAAAMVAQEDRIPMAAMEAKMADKVVVGIVGVTVEVTTTLQGGEDEDSRVTYAYRWS